MHIFDTETLPQSNTMPPQSGDEISVLDLLILFTRRKIFTIITTRLIGRHKNRAIGQTW
jgi:hypothetical protein